MSCFLSAIRAIGDLVLTGVVSLGLHWNERRDVSRMPHFPLSTALRC